MTKTWKENNTLLKLSEAGADFKYRLTPEEKEAMNKPEPNAEEKYGERLWETDKFAITENIEDQVYYTLENFSEVSSEEFPEVDCKSLLYDAVFHVGEKIRSMSYTQVQDYPIEDLGLQHGNLEFIDYNSKNLKNIALGYAYMGSFDQYGDSVFKAYKDIKKKDKFGLYLKLYEDGLLFNKDINVKGIKGLKSKANLLVKGLPDPDFSKEVYSNYRNTLVELATLAGTSKDFDMNIIIEEDFNAYASDIDFCVELPLDKEASSNALKALELIVNLLHYKIIIKLT